MTDQRKDKKSITDKLEGNQYKSTKAYLDHAFKS